MRCISSVGRRLVLSFFLALTALGAINSAPAAGKGDPEIVSLELGFDGVFKLGCWTQAAVRIRGGDEPLSGILQATVEDADMIPAATVTPPERVVGVEPGKESTGRLVLRPGQAGGGITLRLLVDGKPRATRTFRPAIDPEENGYPYGRPATSRIVVLAGPEGGIAELIRADQTGAEDTATVAARITRADQLPLEWYGYEGVEQVVLTTTDATLYRPLGQNESRVEALAKWVERGGRLVIFAAANAEELLGPAGPLAAFAPGKFAGMAPQRESLPIESFADSEDLLNRGAIDMRVPNWEEPAGRVLAYGRNNPAALPLAIRTRRGFGEVTIVGLDPESPPLADWKGREALLRRCLAWPARTAADEQVEAGVQNTAGYDDLANQLRSALDQRFVDVTPASFGLVALLVVGYIALIGPGDYFLVKRVLKRMELTWITFPAIVLATSLGAYWLANAYKGNQLRVNQVELIDVDVETGRARGTAWTHFFNPRAQRFDLAFEPRFAGGTVDDPEHVDSWLGLVGAGLGGMQGNGAPTLELRPSYAMLPHLDGIEGTPVQEWSTKSLTARWSGQVEPEIEARLEPIDDDLLSGIVVNRSQATWNDCLLLHDRWAYRLSQVSPGEKVEIGNDLQPTTIKTRLTSATAGDDATAVAAGDGTVPFDAYGTDVTRLAKLMMFYDAMGGTAYATTLNRYQGFVDLSRLLVGDAAILLVRAPDDAGSHWRRGDKTLTSDKDRRWVFYRFVIPLAPQR